MIIYRQEIALASFECYSNNRKRGNPLKNIPERQTDILSIISSLDISPTMYRNAVEKYQAITKFLTDYGIEADMYPQGSFAFGTVVRPNAKDPSANYDLDFICQVSGNRSIITPDNLRQRIETALRSSNLYGGMLKVYKECFTIEYADINGVGFTIDIVPATDETSDTKKRLAGKSKEAELVESAIAIPRYNSEGNYTWLTNNPKGFRAWFENKNKPYLAASRDTYRKHLFETNQAVFASVEEIPNELDRSALQRVIQILKRHRDIYYAKFKDGDALKPISAIINAVTTQLASQCNPDCSVFALLEYVLNELGIYAQQQTLTAKYFTQIYGSRNVFSRPDGNWYISNPANPEDNLADKWNQDERIPIYFFRWIKAVRSDLIESLQQEDDQRFRTALENGFGSTSVSAVLGKKYCTTAPPKPIASQGVAKPYRSL